MSVDVKITQKGLFKRKIKLTELIPQNCSFGTMDENFVLTPKEESVSMVFYNPKSIARGIEISLDPDDNNSVLLKLSLPTSQDEIKMFYSVIQPVCRRLHTKSFIRDGAVCKAGDTGWMISSDREGCEDGLSSLTGMVEKENNNIFIFGALHPLCIGKREADYFLAFGIEGLERYLHNKQSVDAYYAEPHFYSKKDSDDIFGAYAIGEEIVSVIPTEPSDIMGRVKTSEWYAVLDDGTVKYEDFLNSLCPEDYDYYDAGHILLHGLTKEKIKEIISSYGTTI